jgi:fructose-bisphosphate aldolase class II
MAISIKEIKKSCSEARESIKRAREGHYAIGAFNIDNQETLIAVSKAAAKMHAPVMVEVDGRNTNVR